MLQLPFEGEQAGTDCLTVPRRLSDGGGQACAAACNAGGNCTEDEGGGSCYEQVAGEAQ